MAKNYCDDCKWNAISKGCPVLPCGRYIKPYIATPKGVMKVVETWKMTVPLHDNQGARYPETWVDTIKKHVLDTFGADTEVEAVGRWKQGQRIYVDNSIRVEVDVCTEDHDKAEAYMANAKRGLTDFLKQQRIYVTYSLSSFEFLLPDEFLSDIGLNMPAPENLSQIMVDLYLTLAAPSL